MTTSLSFRLFIVRAFIRLFNLLFIFVHRPIRTLYERINNTIMKAKSRPAGVGSIAFLKKYDERSAVWRLAVCRLLSLTNLLHEFHQQAILCLLNESVFFRLPAVRPWCICRPASCTAVVDWRHGARPGRRSVGAASGRRRRRSLRTWDEPRVPRKPLSSSVAMNQLTWTRLFSVDVHICDEQTSTCLFHSSEIHRRRIVMRYRELNTRRELLHLRSYVNDECAWKPYGNCTRLIMRNSSQLTFHSMIVSSCLNASLDEEDELRQRLI